MRNVLKDLMSGGGPSAGPVGIRSTLTQDSTTGPSQLASAAGGQTGQGPQGNPGGQGDIGSQGLAQHGSLEDITFHENAAERDVVCDAFVHPSHKANKEPVIWGELDPPKLDGKSGQFTKGSQSCNRDIGQGNHYGAPVEYFGPDTDYRAEELDPHQYGKDWEPFPFKDVYKTGDKQWERGFRVSAQDEYDETQTPGAVTDSQPQTQAYGAVEWRGAGPDREIEDYRAFKSQRNFARANKDKKEPYAVDITGLDTKEGKDIR